jgi:hypothetical protein
MILGLPWLKHQGAKIDAQSSQLEFRYGLVVPSASCAPTLEFVEVSAAAMGIWKREKGKGPIWRFLRLACRILLKKPSSYLQRYALIPVLSCQDTTTSISKSSIAAEQTSFPLSVVRRVYPFQGRSFPLLSWLHFPLVENGVELQRVITTDGAAEQEGGFGDSKLLIDLHYLRDT